MSGRDDDHNDRLVEQHDGTTRDPYERREKVRRGKFWTRRKALILRGDPWEQQEQETDHDYLLFKQWLEQPKPRLVSTIWRKAKNKPEDRNVSSQFYDDVFRANRWRYRAACWDRHLEQVERLALEEELRKRGRQRVQALTGLMGVSIQVLAEFRQDDARRATVTFRDLTDAIDRSVRNLRIEDGGFQGRDRDEDVAAMDELDEAGAEDLGQLSDRELTDLLLDRLGVTDE